MPGHSFTITMHTALSRPTFPTPLVPHHDYNHQYPAFLLHIYNIFSNPFGSFPYKSSTHSHFVRYSPTISIDTSITIRTCYTYPYTTS